MLLSSTHPALAQSREVLIGTFGTRSPEAAPADRDRQRPPATRRSQEVDAHRLLEDARDDLSVGNVWAARNQLEMIVRRYPDTTAGREASQILARMSASSAERLDRAERPDRGGNRASDGASSGEPIARTPPAAARPPGRESPASVEARAARLSQDLRLTAGDRVFFFNGSIELGARARQVLAAQAAWLARHPDVVLTVEGHADDDGPAAANTDVARRRGEAVAQRLVAEGVPADRIRVVAYGRDRRIAVCAGAECAAQNRRVVSAVATAPAAASRGDGPVRHTPRP